MDWVSALVLWTPIAVAALVAFIVVLLVLLLLVWTNRLAITAWCAARLSEATTKHGINVALTSTSLWLMPGSGLTLSTVWMAWVAALALIIKPNPEPAANPSKAAPAA